MLSFRLYYTPCGALSFDYTQDDMRRETLLDFFESFRWYKQRFVVHPDGIWKKSFTYEQVASAATSFSAKFHHAGLGKGDRVLLWGDNRAEWIAALWGCLLRGIEVVPVEPRWPADMLVRTQDVAHAKLLLTSNPPPDLGIPVWSLEWPEPAPAPPSILVSPEDTAEILFTSGATAEPKGVIIQHRNILANIVPVEREVLKYRRWGRPFFPLRFLNLLPLSHMFGQAMATFIPPMLPGEVHFLDSNAPHDIAARVRAERISVIVCVPKILEVLRSWITAAVPEAATALPEGTHWLRRWFVYRRVHSLFGWKFWAFVVGAAPLDPGLEEFWKGLGFVVIQGYGLTETAPIVTLNHPFHARKGTAGKPIGGVEVRIAEDGEVLVRGGNVTPGYLNAGPEDTFDADGWLHTGDVGELDEAGALRILGRKKEMIVTPEGLNVFPEDVERVLRADPSVLDAAAVGRDRVHAVLVMRDGADPAGVVYAANQHLQEHQRIRGFSLWPGAELPRTEGTGKLKRRAILDQVERGAFPPPQAAGVVETALARLAPRAAIDGRTPLVELGLTSLERVELLLDLERASGASLDEAAFADARTVADLEHLLRQPPAQSPPVHMPRWNRSGAARALRRINLPLWILPGARIFSQVRAYGLENLAGLEPPVIFAPNHQSHLDVPSLLIALPPKWRYRTAPAMSKEFFDAHFHPDRHTAGERFTNRLNYYLACLLFNAFPFAQREAGTKQALAYAGEVAGEGYSILIFPEGKITETGEIGPFLPGVGLLASRLNLPVVPVRLCGLNHVLHRTWKMARPGPVEVHFGAPMRLAGDDYGALARQLEETVRGLQCRTGLMVDISSKRTL